LIFVPCFPCIKKTKLVALRRKIEDRALEIREERELKNLVDDVPIPHDVALARRNAAGCIDVPTPHDVAIAPRKERELKNLVDDVTIPSDVRLARLSLFSLFLKPVEAACWEAVATAGPAGSLMHYQPPHRKKRNAASTITEKEPAAKRPTIAIHSRTGGSKTYTLNKNGSLNKAAEVFLTKNGGRKTGEQ
jgi:hypothetical protein